MQFLTSGELARLLNITKYTLRHYEEQHLIKPAFVDANGYHMYGESEVYTMAHILLLKELGFSLKDIKCSLEKEMDYTQSLTSVLLRVDREMKRLSTLKRKVQTIIEMQQMDASSLSEGTKEKRHFTYIPNKFLDEAYNLDLKKLAKYKDDSLMVLDELSYVISEGGEKISVMYRSDSLDADYVMTSGTYYHKKITVEQEEELHQEIQYFYDELDKIDVSYEDNLFIHEEAYLSAFHVKSMVYSLEVKAK